MVRAITFDAFGTLIDTGRDVLIRIARAVCDDHQLALDPEALLATWDRYFFGPEGKPSSPWKKSRRAASGRRSASTESRATHDRTWATSSHGGGRRRPTRRSPRSSPPWTEFREPSSRTRTTNS